MPQNSYNFEITPAKVKMNTSVGITVQAACKRIEYDGTTTKYWIYYLWPDGFDESDASDFNSRTMTPSATLTQSLTGSLAQMSSMYSDGENSGPLRCFMFRVFEYNSATQPHTVIDNPASKEIIFTSAMLLDIKNSLGVDDVHIEYAPNVYKLMRKGSLSQIPYVLFQSSSRVASSNLSSNPLHSKYYAIYKDEDNIYNLDDLTNAIYEAIEGHPSTAHMDARVTFAKAYQKVDGNAYFIIVKKYDYDVDTDTYSSTASETRLIFSAKTFDYPNLCDTTWFYEDGTVATNMLNMTYKLIYYNYIITQDRSLISEPTVLPGTIDGKSISISYSNNPSSSASILTDTINNSGKSYYYLSESEAEDYDAHNLDALLGTGSNSTYVIKINGDYDASNVKKGPCPRVFANSDVVGWDVQRTTLNNLYLNSLKIDSNNVDMNTFVSGRTFVPCYYTYSVTNKSTYSLICASAIKYTNSSMLKLLQNQLSLTSNKQFAVKITTGGNTYDTDAYFTIHTKISLENNSSNAASFVNAFSSNPTLATSVHYKDDDSTLASLLVNNDDYSGLYLNSSIFNVSGAAFVGETDEYYLVIWEIVLCNGSSISPSTWNSVFSNNQHIDVVLTPENAL